MQNNIKYSIVIPTFNSEHIISVVATNLLSVCSSFPEISEIIFVNDGSIDNTWNKLVEINKQNGSARIVNLSKNFGQQNATWCGINLSKSDYVFTLDDDYIYTLDDINSLISTLKSSDADVVYGHLNDSNKGLIKKTGATLWKISVKSHNAHKTELGTSIRLFKKDLIFKEHHHIFITNIDEQIDWNTDIKKHIKLAERSSQRKESSYKRLNLFKEIYNHIFGFSTIPLRYITAIGFIFASISFLVGLFYLYQKFFLKIKVIGFASLIVSITFSTGLILIGIGTLAQYIGTIINLQMKRPAYHIKEIID